MDELAYSHSAFEVKSRERARMSLSELLNTKHVLCRFVAPFMKLRIRVPPIAHTILLFCCVFMALIFIISPRALPFLRPKVRHTWALDFVASRKHVVAAVLS